MGLTSGHSQPCPSGSLLGHVAASREVSVLLAGAAVDVGQQHAAHLAVGKHAVHGVLGRHGEVRTKGAHHKGQDVGMCHHRNPGLWPAAAWS